MVKISDIAKALGVSIGTVDRALHGRPRIDPATRARVLEAARSMGYQVNLAASVLATNAEVVTALDNSCLMQIYGGLHRSGSPVRTLHLAEILASEAGPA